VKIVVDIEGEHIYQPETDEDWHVVWQAGIAIAESANLLMDDERALDQGDWLTMSNALYDAGLSAARAAEAKDYEAVLAEGETVYNACTACHEQYMPTVNL
jgi:cytochrome c5